MITLAQERERRRHILRVTLGIARGGGYDAVQVRVVAERADVALATLYRYFPSKPNLLVSVLESELDRIGRKVLRFAYGSEGRYQHLWRVIAKLNTEMARDPRLAEAMARAFMIAYTTKDDDADRVRHQLDSMFAKALAGGEPTPLQRQMACIVVDAWVSNALSWLNRRATTEDVNWRLWHLLTVLARRDGVPAPLWSHPSAAVADPRSPG
jgi:AcrR family transcriptional regulator